MSKKLFLCFIVLIFNSCGIEQADKPLDEETSSLRYSDSEGHEYTSYMVAFKNNLDGKGLSFHDAREGMKSHQRALNFKYGHILGLSSMTYLASLNMNDLGASFHNEIKIDKFQFLALEDSLKNKEDKIASLVKVEFVSAEQAKEVLEYWKRTDQIYYAEPDFRSTLSDAIYDRVTSEFVDESSTPEWLNQIDFVQAIEYLNDKDLSTPIVAVMDSGLDIEHPALSSNLYENTLNTNTICKDDTNGCDTTKWSKDFLGEGEVYPSSLNSYGTSCDTSPNECGHGTHVAGIIVAQPSENEGTYGVCPYCRVFPIKLVDDDFAISDSAIIAGFSYVSGFKQGSEPAIRIINASFGKYDRSKSVELFINALKNFGKGTLVIAAAGNEDTMKRSLPAAYANAIAVSNVKYEKEDPAKAASSNFGMWVDIAAPGSPEIYSTMPGGEYKGMGGTSMAAPVVSGVAGLVLAAEPELTASELEDRLLRTSVPDKLYADGVNDYYRPIEDGIGLVPLLGSGVVNAFLALKPEGITTPTVVAVRPDSVTAGCGVIAGASGGSAILFLLPLLLMVFRKREA